MIATLLITLILILIDRALKVVMTSLLAAGPITVIPGVYGLRYIENRGIAFGAMEGLRIPVIIVTAVLIIIIMYILMFKKLPSGLHKTALIMIAAGGLANLYDRVFMGYVVDYVETLFIDFPIFNFADALINIGCVLLLIAVFFKEGKHKEKHDEL